MHRVLEQGQAQIQPGQFKAGSTRVGFLADQTAIAVAVKAVGTVEAHKGVQVIAADDPTVRRDRVTRGDSNLPDAAREREAPVDRHKVGGLHRHAGVVELALTEVRRIEEGAQNVFIGLAVRRNSQRVGRRAFDHLQAQTDFDLTVQRRCELKQAVAVVVAEEAGAQLKVAHHRAGLDQAVAARQARLQVFGQLDVDGTAFFNRQRAADLQLVVLVVVLAAELQRQALVGGDGLAAHDADQARRIAAAKGAGCVLTDRIDDAQALAGGNHHITCGAGAIAHGQRVTGRSDQIDRSIGREFDRALVSAH